MKYIIGLLAIPFIIIGAFYGIASLGFGAGIDLMLNKFLDGED